MMRSRRSGGGFVALMLSLTLGLALAGTGVLGAADAELAFTKGQDAFQQGDFQKALRNFRQARDEDPDRAEYAHWEGVTLLRLRRHQDALTVLEQAREMAGARRLSGLSYDLGVARYQTGDADGAVRELREALREDPDNHRARFFLALCYREMDRTSEALAELETVRREAPEMTEEVSLLMGRIYAEEGETDRAATELRAAASAQDQRIAGLGRDYLRQIEITADGRERKRWRFDGYGAVEYDTNVVLNPEDPGVDFPVTDSEDWRTEWWGKFQFNPVAKPNAVFGLSYGFYQTLHEDLEEFDFRGHLPQLTGIYRKGRHTWWGTGGVEFYDLDDDSYLRRWQIQNNYFYRTGDSGRLHLYHRYRDDTFFSEEERTGDEHFFGVAQTIFPWKTKARWLRFGFGLGDRDAGNDFSYTTREVDVSFFTPMGEIWYFFAALRWTNFDYEDPHSIFGVFRNDDDMEAAMRITYEMTEHWNLIGEYRYTDHDSNIDFFSYKRHIMTVGVTTSY